MFPAPGADAPADLAQRFASVLNGLGQREVSAEALFETLKLEALDWGMDRAVTVDLIGTTQEKADADDNR